MKKTISVLLGLALVLGLGLTGDSMAVAEDGIINVPDDHLTIQAAIDAASDGDTVKVAAGVYKENIEISKSLTLLGAQEGVDGRSPNGPETIIEADDDAIGISIINDTGRVVVIDGLTIRNALHAMSTPDDPERRPLAAEITVRNVRALNSGEFGLSLTFTRRATIEHCYVEGARYGINAGALRPTPPTVASFRNNLVVDVRYGIIGYLQDSVIEGNLVWCKTKDSRVTEGEGIRGQFIDTVVRNNISRGYTKGSGMSFAPRADRDLSRNVTVEGNILTENLYGIYVFPPPAEYPDEKHFDIKVHFNKIFGNSSFGVRNDGPVTLDATANWWGHADGPGLGSRERDRVSARVRYSPWLGAEPGTIPMLWGVHPTGSIQDAVDLAASGDTIIVSEGEYREDLVVEKSLTMRSATGAETTTIIGSVLMEPAAEASFFGGNGAGFTVRAEGREFALRLCLENAGHVTIRENILTGGAAGMSTCPGGLGDNSVMTISYSRISQNNGYGIYLASVGIGSVVLVNFNDIADNGSDGLYIADSAVTVDATNNWWGDASGPYSPVMNPGGGGNGVSGNVSCQPWLSAPLCTLKISSAGGGVVTVPGERAFIYAPGVEVDLEATPNSGYEFDRWIGDVDAIINVRAPATTIIMNDDCSIVATFKSLPCFIAAAAYGTDTADELDVLRDFRDSTLLPNSLGAWFVGLYYRTSPPVASYISRYEALRTAVRVGLIGPMVVVLTLTQGLWSLAD